jgi:hypothetical protein
MGTERAILLKDGSRDFGNGVIGPSRADVEFSESFTQRHPTDSTANSVVPEQSRVEPRRLPIPRALRPIYLAMAVGGIGLAVACGGAKGQEPTQTPTSFKPTPSEALTVNPTGTSTTTPETSTVRPPETGKGPEPTPTTTATPELIIEIKKIPPEEIPAKMEQLVGWLSALTPQYVASVYPGHPEVQDQGVVVAKDNVQQLLVKSQEVFKKGNVEEGRKYLLEVADFMDGFAFVGDSKEGIWMPQEIKAKFDPLGKYISKSDHVSEVWRDTMYLPIINILVSTDKEYPSQVRLR